MSPSFERPPVQSGETAPDQTAIEEQRVEGAEHDDFENERKLLPNQKERTDAYAYQKERLEAFVPTGDLAADALSLAEIGDQPWMLTNLRNGADPRKQLELLREQNNEAIAKGVQSHHVVGVDFLITVVFPLQNQVVEKILEVA